MLLRDVFDIPAKVDASDYVLQLTSGVAHADRTVADYVVTPALAGAFDEALGLVGRTLTGGTSKAAFVDGSFGSGKSHFMAVLHLLLAGHPGARALPGLQQVVTDRQAVLGRRVLTIDYHLLAKESLEAALFQGYLDRVAALHPDAAPPVLHQSDALLADAARFRAELGDGAFFSRLAGSSGASAGWGARAAAWTASSYDDAVAAPVDDPRRAALVNALVATYFQGYARAGQWLELSAGLRAMTEHARGLGYDGVVLFLDELVLWLAQHLGDSAFIQNESSKVAKLVETEMASLPVPLVSFVARQQGLAQFLGSSTAGVEQAAIEESFRWWVDRFERIELAASDLPQIVHRRLLRPVSDEARAAVAAAVARVQGDPTAWAYLLTDATGSSGTDFALTYPFSPALVDTMVALSALMQRERTALRIMGELLSSGRDTLSITDVIPVGDLFDAVVLGGGQPLSPLMVQLFADARRFYEGRLRPYLLGKHHLTPAAAGLEPRTGPFHTEDRLAKTLLVAALASGAPSLRNLTASKLAALNYGTISSFVPGQQAQVVMTLVKQWAAEFGEVHIGEGTDPVVSLTLTGVDYDVVLESVLHEDTESNRRRLLQKILSDEVGITTAGTLLAAWTTSVVWRGSRREVDVVFGNVRDTAELSDEALRAQPGHWKVVVDVPFDTGDHTAQEDLNRVMRIRERGEESATLVWLPHFLTAERMADVGRLAQLEYLLTGEHFAQNASQLNPTDREPARQALENQRRSLRARVLDVLRQAYGVTAATPENVDTQIAASEVFTTLLPGVTIAPPVAASLRAALDGALRQGMDAQYPDHPVFDPVDTEVRRSELTTVLEQARAAVDAGGRLDGVERTRAAVLRRVANPLHVGAARETVYALTPETFGWLGDFTRWSSDAADGGVRVADLRVRLQRFGMVTDVEDLVIAAWAALDDREWVRAGTPVPAPSIGSLSNDLVLRPARLPSADHWAAATRAATALFGVPPQPRRSAVGLSRLARSVREKVAGVRVPVGDLAAQLTSHAAALGLDGSSARLATATIAADLVDRLARESDDAVLVEVLATTALPPEPQALAFSMTSAAQLVGDLRRADWDMLGRVSSVPEGTAVLADLASVAREEQLHVPLGPALAAAGTRARDLLLPPRADVQPGPGRVEPGPGRVEPGPGGVDPGTGRVDPGPGFVRPGPGPGGPLTDPDEVVLAIDSGDGWSRSLVGQLRQAAEKARAQGKRLHVRWWIE